MTAPTIAPVACTFPPWISSATTGYAASASSTAATTAPSRGDPSPVQRFSRSPIREELVLDQ